MCGINGIFGLTDTRHSRQLVDVMNRTLAHRGPDDEGLFSHGTIALGHRRLSVIDPSPAGHQPMLSADGRFAVVFNGTLYNYRELRSRLEGYPFRSDSDTEVLLAAYAVWGEACLDRFDGMFAFAIWDCLRQELFLARDRLGIKPLYFFVNDGLFLFSSELRALLASGLVPRRLDRAGLVDFLRFQIVHAPATILQEVSALLPGHCLLVTKQETRIRRYWRPISRVDHSEASISYGETCGKVRGLLQSAVERQSVSDVPLGVFLSGGIDSSTITALMSQASKTRVQTFTVVPDDDRLSEAASARAVAKAFHTDHYEIPMSSSSFAEDIPDALKAMDHPSGDGPNVYVVARATRNFGVKVAFSGLGGDELFAGYPVFRGICSLQRYRVFAEIPRAVRTAVGRLIAHVRGDVFGDKLAAALNFEALDLFNVYPLFRRILPDPEIAGVLSFELEEPDANLLGLSRMGLHDLDEDHWVSKITVAELTTYMQNVLLGDADQMAMAQGLEVRVPFLDHELVEYVLTLPDGYKDPWHPKKLLLDALAGLLPRQILNQPKMGFSLPWSDWMKRELRSFCEARISSFACRSFANEKAVRKLWSSFASGDPRVTWARVWHVIVLESWLATNGVE